MKKLPVILVFIATFCCCKNDDDNNTTNPIDQLPPATQTGENTFGCLLDGDPFLPGAGVNPLDCVYQFSNGGYYFTLQANREDENFNRIRLGCNTKDLEIQEGQTYELVENENGNATGKYFYATFINYTSSVFSGELTITKLDETNNIVSGTFFYDIEDQNGVVHEIREGRFDMRFSQ